MGCHAAPNPRLMSCHAQFKHFCFAKSRRLWRNLESKIYPAKDCLKIFILTFVLQKDSMQKGETPVTSGKQMFHVVCRNDMNNRLPLRVKHTFIDK